MRFNKHWLAAFLTLLAILPFLTLVAQAAEPDFGGSTSFRARWIEQDGLVGTSGVNRPFTWGPGVPNAPTTLTESYTNSPNAQRRVLYLDKARMEINNPADGFVTTGLAVKELVSGLRQDGDSQFTPLFPSQTQVAGDPVSVNPSAPVYASFKALVTLGNADGNSRPSAIGTRITGLISKDGLLGAIEPPEPIIVGAYEFQTGHNIAQPFHLFKTQRGPLTNPATGAIRPDQPLYTTDPTSNVFGLAISEPYWVRTKIAGAEQTVLVQLFERRVLTYNPALPFNKVEMGNLGQHYYQWRYIETAGTPPPPTTNPPPNPFGLDSEEAAFLTALNSYRQANGKSALTLNQNLLNAAKWMSNDMATKNYLSHTDSQGRDPFQRMTAFGYTSNTQRGENVAAGQQTAAQLLETWRNSSEHNVNLLDDNFRVIGIGRAYDAKSTYKWYWTAKFGGE